MKQKLSFLRIIILMSVCLFFNIATAQNSHQQIIADIGNSMIKSSIEKRIPSTDPCAASQTTTVTLDQAVSDYLTTLEPDGSWTDIDYSVVSVWQIDIHVDRMRTFAMAYASSSSNYHNQATVHNALQQSLHFFITLNPKNSNWWINDIWLPRNIGQILIITRAGNPQLSSTAENEVFQWMDTLPNPDNYTGANKADIALWHFYQGLLKDNASEVNDAINASYEILDISTNEGIQPDYSYHQHGPQLYLLNYGEVTLARVSAIAKFVEGTPYALSGQYLSNYSNFLLGGFSEMRRGQYATFSAPGRQIVNKGKLKSGGGPFNVAMEIDPANASTYQILRDRADGTVPANYGVDARHTFFYRSLFTTHRREGFLFSVLANNYRTKKTETGNNENIKGRFLSEGATNILVNGNEYYNIFPIWEWSKIPGTTVPQYTGSDLRPPNNWGVQGKSDFSGGVSDGEYGVQTFKMDDFDTQAKKAWFSFDDEVVCLGAGISSSAAQGVATTVNQSWLEGAVKIRHNGAVSTLSKDTHSYANGVDWILHDSVGYFFPAGGNLKLSNQTQTGSWSDINTSACADPVSGNVFKLWFDHGTNPQNHTYAYIVAPGKTTTSQMQTYNLGNIEILRNDTELQAVKHNALDMIQAVFYQAGTYDLGNGFKLGVSKPCTLLLRQVSTSNIKIHLADPAETGADINVGWESPSLSPMRKVIVQTPSNPENLGASVSTIINNNSLQGAILVKQTFKETFENMTLSGWGTETYIGDNGLQWTVEGKGVSGYLNSKNIYFNPNTVGATSQTITGGIKSFSVSCKDLWTEGVERKLQLIINGAVIATSTHTGTEPYEFKVEGINIPGDYVIQLKNVSSSGVIVIDDISWGEYHDHVETFSNMSLVGWGDETYIGDNGQEWSVSGKGVSGYIDGKQIYFQGGGTGLTSGIIDGGISTFSMDCRDLWDDGIERKIDLIVNGEVIRSFTHIGTGIYTLTANEINIPGDFTMQIRNSSVGSGSEALAIDNISWNGFEATSIVYDNVETFTNMSLSGWGSETYIGDNAQQWSVVGKGVSGYIDGKGLYFHKNTIGATSGIISGGIGSFSVDCKDLWDNGVARKIELLVNGQVVADYSHVGTETYTFKVDHADIPGDVILEIRNATEASGNITLAIDNIKWSSFTTSNVLKSRKQADTEKLIQSEIKIDQGLYIKQNPVKDKLLLGNNSGFSDFYIHDISGQLIQHNSADMGTGDTMVFDVSAYKTGIYFLRAYDKQNGFSVLRFIKE